VSGQFRRILVVKLRDLGDLVLTTPALAALREAQPNAQIDLLAQPVAAELVRGTGLVDDHLRMPRAALEAAVWRGPSGWIFLAALAGALSRRRYDACVLLEHLITRPGVAKYAALTLATGAPRRFGLDNGRGWFLTDRVRDDGFSARPEAEHWLSVAGLLGADTRPRPARIPTAPDDERYAEALLAGLPRPLVALHPGSGGYAPARRWPIARFERVGAELARRGSGLVVVGNEAELNGRLACATGARDLSHRTTVRQLAALLARVDLLVTNDSGVMHVGAAAGAPIVALFGQTDPRAWGPYYGLPSGQGRAEVVELPLPCRPCLYRGHELGWRQGCATRDCLELLSVGQVLAACERQLARSVSGSLPRGCPAQ
jgi:ADP-heptose:LPS heptosyltransferase